MKETMRKTTKYASTAVLGLTLSLLTACGGSSSKSGDTVTTIPNCSADYHYNTTTNIFQVSTTDTTECSLLDNNSIDCSADKIAVRIPVNQNFNNGINCPVNQNGLRQCNTFNTNNTFNNTNISSSYYSTLGQYTETCVDSSYDNWNYIVYGDQYNWLDVDYLSSSAGYYVSYHGSLGAAINSGDLPDWVLPVLGAGAGAAIGHSVDGQDGAILGGITGAVLGVILNN